LRTQDRQSYERDKTPEEQIIVETVLQCLPAFIEEYRGSPVARLSPDVIHILDRDNLTETEREELVEEGMGGGYVFQEQRAVIIPDDRSKLKTAERIVHELMHFESFTSFESPSSAVPPNKQYGPPIEIGDTELLPRRIGLSIFDKTHGKRFFTILMRRLFKS